MTYPKPSALQILSFCHGDQQGTHWLLQRSLCFSVYSDPSCCYHLDFRSVASNCCAQTSERNQCVHLSLTAHSLPIQPHCRTSREMQKFHVCLIVGGSFQSSVETVAAKWVEQRLLPWAWPFPTKHNLVCEKNGVTSHEKLGSSCFLSKIWGQLFFLAIRIYPFPLWILHCVPCAQPTPGAENVATCLLILIPQWYTEHSKCLEQRKGMPAMSLARLLRTNLTLKSSRLHPPTSTSHAVC